MMKAFEDVSKTNKEMMDSTLKSYAAMTKGMQTIATEATDYSKSSYEHGAAAFEKLAATKSFEKAIEVQTEFAKQAYDAFVAQASKMSELYADLAKEAYKPFEGIVPAEMVNSATEMMNSAQEMAADMVEDLTEATRGKKTAK